jgi:hypothetical protein
LRILQRAVLGYIEDNAIEDGSCMVTLDQLAEVMSCPEQEEVVTRYMVRAAALALAKKGLIEITTVRLTPLSGGSSQAQSQAQSNRNLLTRYVRVNYSEYQANPLDQAQPQAQSQAHSSRRSKRRRTTTPKGDEAKSLLAAMRQEYEGIIGERLDVPVKDYGHVRGIRNIGVDDAEVLRRWRLFLADSYWPVKSVATFRRAFQNRKYQQGKGVSLVPSSSLPDEARQLQADLDSYTNPKRPK